MKRLLRWAVALLTIACVSKSVFDARFAESQSLSAPTVSVSLANPSRFSFGVVGDLHVGAADTTRFRTILNRASGEGDEFMVLLGDIVDQGHEDDVEAVHQALTVSGYLDKYLPVIGNHDVFYSGWEAYRNRFGASHYTVDIGNSRFLALDTADGVVGEDQTAWLEAELKKPQPDNTFIISHYLPVVPGQRTYLRLSNQLEAERLMKLASTHGVRAWLGAHYHSYIKDTIDGVTYLVAGGGGGRRMEPVASYFFAQVMVDGTDVSYALREVP